MNLTVCVCVCMCVYACVCMRVCVSVNVCSCVCLYNIVESDSNMEDSDLIHNKIVILSATVVIHAYNTLFRRISVTFDDCLFSLLCNI